jgi:hypothetical protein
MGKQEHKIVWLGGYPHLEGVNEPGQEQPKPTHYVMFLVNDVAFSTDNLTKEQADYLAGKIGGIVMPLDLKELLNGDAG